LAKIFQLIKKEFLLELRNKYALGSILLFGLSTVFVVFKAFSQFSTMTWNVMFWVLFLFISTNAVLKSFTQEKGSQAIYLYTLLNPYNVIIAKMIYNLFFLVGVGFMIYILFIYFSFDPVRDLGLFALDIFLVAFGLSVIFSFVSAIAAMENNSSVLMAVLGMPLVLPVLLSGIKISTIALGITMDSEVNTDLLLLLAIDLMLAGVVIILFPILWKS